MAVFMTYDEIVDVQEWFKEYPEELEFYESIKTQALKDAYVRGLLRTYTFQHFRLKLRVRELKKSIKELGKSIKELGKKIKESVKRVFWR